MMSDKTAQMRLQALQKAEDRANNPEFKELWAIKRKELIRLLQQGNSYDELSGELI